VDYTAVARDNAGKQDQKMNTASDWINHCSKALDAGGSFFGHGTDNARDEARWLVLTAMQRDPQAPFVDDQLTLDQDCVNRIRTLLQRRISEHVPLAYLTGQAWFCGLEFKVTPAVLVPRSPIAEMITARFSPWLAADGICRILDLCTGSGCIAIATALNLPEIAALNVQRHNLSGRVELIQSDLFEAVEGRQYDLILSNPPYVSKAEYEALPGEYHAEPEVGLVSGDDGLDIVLRILVEAAEHLSEAGMLVCEVGESRAALESALPGVPFLWPDFESGGMGVFLLNRHQLNEASGQVRELMEKRQDV
jgi:ribosomal protein L3 glutamine methyltransferase